MFLLETRRFGAESHDNQWLHVFLVEIYEKREIKAHDFLAILATGFIFCWS